MSMSSNCLIQKACHEMSKQRAAVKHSQLFGPMVIATKPVLMYAQDLSCEKGWQCNVSGQMACTVCADVVCGMQKEQGSQDNRPAGT